MKAFQVLMPANWFYLEPGRIDEFYAFAGVCVALTTCIYFLEQVMITRPRSDLHVNLPALRKLDAMLLVINKSCIILLFFLGS